LKGIEALKRLGIIGLVISILAAGSSAAGQALGFKESLRQCLKTNFDIQQSELSVKEKEPGMIRARGEFDYNLNASYAVDHSDTPSASTTDGVASAVISDTKTSKLELKTKSSWLGTELSLPFSYSASTSNSSFARIPEGHNTSFGLSLTQPLLKPFFAGYIEKRYIKAKLDLRLAQQKHGETLERSLQKAIQLYLETVQAQETVKVKESSLTIARDLFEAARAKEAMGKISVLDRLEAEARFNRSQESLLTAQAAFTDKKQEFFLHTFANPEKTDDIFNEIESLEKEPPVLSLDQGIRSALEKRVEAQSARTSIEGARTELKHAQVDRLPSVSLEASRTHKGLADNFSDSEKQINEAEHVSTSTGVKLEMPLMGYAATGEKEIKNLRLSQENLKQQNLLRNIRLEVIKSQRQVQIQWARLAALKKVVQAESLKAEGQSRRYNQGQVPIADLNQALQDKENALLELLKGRVNYVRALYDFSKARGTLIDDLDL